MVKERSTEESKAETPSGDEVQKAEGLSRRDALEVALVASRESGSGAESDKRSKSDTEGVGKEEKSGKGDVGDSEELLAKEEKEALQPPAEFDTEEKADFLQASRKGQEAILRLHKSRNKYLDKIKAEAAELQWAKDLAKEAEPYLKAVGEKMKPHEAVILSLKMRNEFDKGDPKKTAAQYLKAKGIEPPKELLEDSTPSTQFEEQISPIQTKLNAIEQKIAKEEFEKKKGFLSSEWSSFEQEKNAAGELKFPDIQGNSEQVFKLSSNIGSLVGGETDLSKQFIANVTARIPGLTFQGLLKEAYRYSGGRVDDSETARTQENTQKHILKSNRAAASVPGQRGAGSVSGPVKKFKTRREALAHAIAEQSEGA